MDLVLNLDSTVTVTHRITNTGAWDAEFAPWAITVMSPGGLEIIPQPKREAGMVQNRILALWPYSDMSDSRVSWGRDYITLRSVTGEVDSFKFGINSEHGFSAYFNHGNMFIKRFSPVQGGTYPDGGVSYETYTDKFVLEMETLGELKRVKPNETVGHTETWSLVLGVPEPKSEREIAAVVEKYII